MSESIAIVGLVTFVIVREVLSYKERIMLAKINKANNVNEVLSLDVKSKENEVEEDSLVDVADMPDLPLDK